MERVLQEALQIRQEMPAEQSKQNRRNVHPQDSASEHRWSDIGPWQLQVADLENFEHRFSVNEQVSRIAA